MNSVDLVNEIVTSYGVQVFNVERVIAEYGPEMTEAALVAVRDLPIPPESPFGWMISQLRNGKIQARHVAAAKAGAGATERAKRYCDAQHTNQDTAAKRLAGQRLADPELQALAHAEQPATCAVCDRRTA